MADPRLETFAAEAESRGWEIEWSENDAETALLVYPVLTYPYPDLPFDSDFHRGMFSFGFSVAVGDHRQELPLVFWAWEGGGGGFICPWAGSYDDQMRLGMCSFEEKPAMFPTVSSFEEGLPLFDQGVARWMATVRSETMKCGDAGTLYLWSDPAPLAAAAQEVA
jgi:hypothetical protein